MVFVVCLSNRGEGAMVVVTVLGCYTFLYLASYKGTCTYEVKGRPHSLTAKPSALQLRGFRFNPHPPPTHVFVGFSLH